MKVIISAYACQPNMGSEEGVGWNWVNQISQRGHEVHVITKVESRAAIEARLEQGEIENLTFYYIDTPAVLRSISGFWGWLYYSWQIGVAFKAKQLQQEIGFDLAHHVTYAIDWMPSGLAVLNIPFIWGPIGGSSHKLPKHLKLNLSSEAKKAELTRNLLQWGFKTFDPWLKLTMKRATIILPYTQEAVAGIPKKYQHKTRPIIHIGADLSELDGKSRDRQIDTSQSRLKIFTGGRLVHWKGFDLLLEGLSLHLKETGADTKIVCTSIWSEGKAYLNDLAKTFGVEQQIEFLGKLPTKNDVFSEMRDCDLYALPTWRDGPPTAILEAMLQGLPILCLDFGATGELVPDGAGFKIPAYSHQQIVRDIATALTQASKDRSALLPMGKIGQKHALEVYNWDNIGAEIQRVYEQILPEAASEMHNYQELGTGN